MIYLFLCDECHLSREFNASIKLGPPDKAWCLSCNHEMRRDYKGEGVTFNASACKDHDDIPMESRVTSGAHDRGDAGAARKEAGYHKHIKDRRSALADGGNRGSLRHTNSVPAELYHGKIRETGDKQYWSDPKNLARHASTKVS